MQGKPPDSDLLIDGVIEHCWRWARAPAQVAADRGFWIASNQHALTQLGVKQVRYFAEESRALSTRHRNAVPDPSAFRDGVTVWRPQSVCSSGIMG